MCFDARSDDAMIIRRYIATYLSDDLWNQHAMVEWYANGIRVRICVCIVSVVRSNVNSRICCEEVNIVPK